MNRVQRVIQVSVRGDRASLSSFSFSLPRPLYFNSKHLSLETFRTICPNFYWNYFDANTWKKKFIYIYIVYIDVQMSKLFERNNSAFDYASNCNRTFVLVSRRKTWTQTGSDIKKEEKKKETKRTFNGMELQWYNLVKIIVNFSFAAI